MNKNELIAKFVTLVDDFYSSILPAFAIFILGYSAGVNQRMVAEYAWFSVLVFFMFKFQRGENRIEFKQRWKNNLREE